MRLTMRCSFVAMILIAGTVAGLARTAEQAALSSARKRGYSAEQTRCFVQLFPQYAQLTRRGHWVAGSKNPSNKRAAVYRHRAYAECGVVR